MLSGSSDIPHLAPHVPLRLVSHKLYVKKYSRTTGRYERFQRYGAVCDHVSRAEIHLGDIPQTLV